ncbi:hypothetical protein J6590_006970 [Homalodisca vitripennis]|nr:hypothetical protein J6590_006970 [Homalodisca vitripennis]
MASGDLELGRGYVAAPRASVKSVCNYFTSFNTHTPPNEYGSFYVKSAGQLGSQNLYLFNISNACKQIWLFWQQGGPSKTDLRAGFGPRAAIFTAFSWCFPPIFIDASRPGHTSTPRPTRRVSSVCWPPYGGRIAAQFSTCKSTHGRTDTRPSWPHHHRYVEFEFRIRGHGAVYERHQSWI